MNRPRGAFEGAGDVAGWKRGASIEERFRGRALGVATIHGKEQVIGPALMQVLELAGFRAIEGIDTDRFGAFSGEVQRAVDPRTAALLKARHGAEIGAMDLVVASEGSFGPYPPAPFLSCDEEFLVLYDARDGAVFEYRHVSLNTVFGGERCDSWKEVQAFAERMSFPAQGLVVRSKERWSPGDVLHKGIIDPTLLRACTTDLIDRHGSCWVETDMRAMMNPTRMQVIAETADRFAQELARACPACRACWFRVTGAGTGLPCGLCGWPTEMVRTYVRSCAACGHEAHDARPDGLTAAEPQHCGTCNP